MRPESGLRKCLLSGVFTQTGMDGFDFSFESGLGLFLWTLDLGQVSQHRLVVACRYVLFCQYV